MRLTAACGVAGRLDLLTYWSVCCAVSAAGALPAAVIRDFGDGFSVQANVPQILFQCAFQKAARLG